MSDESTIAVTLPADVQQIDQTGYVWAFLDAAPEPERVASGALIGAGDAEELQETDGSDAQGVETAPRF